MAAQTMLLSRVRGSLVAAVLGDCIGEIFEGMSAVGMTELTTEIKTMERKWSEKQQKMSAGKASSARPLMCYTDDTAMARCIAASLVDKKSVDVKDIATRFAKEYASEPQRGYEGNVVTVLKALGDPNLDDIFQPAREQFNGSGSYGNGGGMRISPLGLFFHQQSLEDLKEKTVSITELTHSHPHAIMGAILQSFAVHLSLSLDNSQPLEPSSFLQQLLELMRPVERDIYAKHKLAKKKKEEESRERKESGEESEDTDELPYCDKLELMKEFLAREVDVDEVDEKLGTNISALCSVPTAVYCFLKGAGKSLPGWEERSGVEQTILYAISLGGDTDTIATMAGAIAGAYFGLEAIPQSWRDSCEGVDDAMMAGKEMVKILTSAKKP